MGPGHGTAAVHTASEAEILIHLGRPDEAAAALKLDKTMLEGRRC